MIDAWFRWTTRSLSVLAILGSAMPPIRTGRWPVRLWDFPRVQLPAFCAALAAVLFVGVAVRETDSVIDLVLGALVAIASLSHSAVIVQHTKFYSRSVENCSDAGFTLLIANVDFRNAAKREVASSIERIDPDLLLLIEFDDGWMQGLSEIRGRFPHRLEEPREGGVGIALWSKLEICDGAVEYLVSESRPSVHATLRIRGGRSVRFIGLQAARSASSPSHSTNSPASFGHGAAKLPNRNRFKRVDPMSRAGLARGECLTTAADHAVDGTAVALAGRFPLSQLSRYDSNPLMKISRSL